MNNEWILLGNNSFILGVSRFIVSGFVGYILK